jgi:hypothetical protein
VDTVASDLGLQLLVLNPLPRVYHQISLLFLLLFYIKIFLIFIIYCLAEIIAIQDTKLALTLYLYSQAVTAPQYIYRAAIVAILRHIYQAAMAAILQPIYQAAMAAILQYILQVTIGAIPQRVREIKYQL